MAELVVAYFPDGEDAEGGIMILNPKAVVWGDDCAGPDDIENAARRTARALAKDVKEKAETDDETDQTTST